MIRAVITEIVTGMIRNKLSPDQQRAEGATQSQAASQQARTQQTPPQESTEEKTPARCMQYRVVALLADGIPVWIMATILAGIFAMAFGRPGLFGGFLFIVPAVIARTVYHAPLEHYYGYTPGKRLTGLRVYGPDGVSPPSLQQAVIRNALRIVDGLVFNLVGFIVALTSGERKRIGDRVSGTKVLQTSENSLLQRAAENTKLKNTVLAGEGRTPTPSGQPGAQQQQPEGAAEQSTARSPAQTTLDEIEREVVRTVSSNGEHAYVYRTPQNIMVFDTRGSHFQTTIVGNWAEGHATLSEDEQSVLIDGEWHTTARTADPSAVHRSILCLTRATFLAPDGQQTSHYVTTLGYLDYELLAYKVRRTPEQLDYEVSNLDQEQLRSLSAQLVYWPPQRQTEQPVSLQSAPESTGGQQPYLSLYAKDLTASARAGEIPPVIGREDQIKQVLRTLSRTTKNNPVLRGEAGVGKTAVAEGLARLAAGIEESREVPKELAGMELHEVSLSTLEAGTTMRGMFEERLEGLLAEVQGRDDVILFVDELHRLMSAGAAGSDTAPAAQILKPALSRGEMKLIGATTTDEYRQIEKDAAMERRLQPVDVPPLTQDQTVQVLFQTRDRYEKDDVILEDGAIIAAAEWADRYIEGNLPDRAIDLVDDVAAGKRMESGGLVTTADVSNLVAERTGIKPETSGADRDKLSGLEDELKARVIGQHHASGAVARTVRRQQTLGDERPASLLFLGSSGVGKTELAKALAASLFGSERRMVRLDMSEFQNEFGLSRLLGSSQGYRDSEEGGQLTEAVRRQPYSVILLDEIEKANRGVLTILLQLLGDGRLTDGRGREVDFSNCIVIMTSNVGAQRVLAGERDPAAITEDLLAAGFLPELIGRIDERVVFHPLSGEDLQRIVRGLVGKVAERAHRRQDVELTVDDSLIADLVDKGYDPRFGARDIRNQVRSRVEDYFADLITKGYVGGDSGITRVGLWHDAEDGEDCWHVPQDHEPEERKPTEEAGPPSEDVREEWGKERSEE